MEIAQFIFDHGDISVAPKEGSIILEISAFDQSALVRKLRMLQEKCENFIRGPQVKRPERINLKLF